MKEKEMRRVIDWERDKEYSDVWLGYDRKTGIRVWQVTQGYGKWPFKLLWVWNCYGPYVGSYATLKEAQGAAGTGKFREQVGVANWKHIDEYGSKSVEELATELVEQKQASISAIEARHANYSPMAIERKKEEIARRGGEEA